METHGRGYRKMLGLTKNLSVYAGRQKLTQAPRIAAVQYAVAKMTF